MEASMYKAFLSYQSSDRSFVEVLATSLRSNGVSVFFDQWDIAGGDSIPGEIEKGISDCNIFIYVLSAASTQSKWVQAEYHAFLFRKLNEHSLRIIPVLRSDCKPPSFIAPLKYVDFRLFDTNDKAHHDPSHQGPLKEFLSAVFRKSFKPTLEEPHPSLACYELDYRNMKNPPLEAEYSYYELGFKNITDSPLLNFEFALYFEQAVESVEYDFSRSSANFTGGKGLSKDRKRFHWRGNQIVEDGGWIVFLIKTSHSPNIGRVSTKLLGRLAETNELILPDPKGLKHEEADSAI